MNYAIIYQKKLHKIAEYNKKEQSKIIKNIKKIMEFLSEH